MDEVEATKRSEEETSDCGLKVRLLCCSSWKLYGCKEIKKIYNKNEQDINLLFPAHETCLNKSIKTPTCVFSPLKSHFRASTQIWVKKKGLMNVQQNV